MKRNFFCLLIITSALLALSCVSVKNAGGLKPVYITNSKKINLLSPSACSVNVDEVQLLTGSFGETSFSLISYTQIDENTISLALMNDFGTDMGSLFYDGNTASFDSAYFPQNLPAEYILADIQNAYYDAEKLSVIYSASHLIFESDTLQGTRRIYDGKKLIEEITISQSSILIKNFLRGYSYTLETAH